MSYQSPTKPKRQGPIPDGCFEVYELYQAVPAGHSTAPHTSHGFYKVSEDEMAALTRTMNFKEFPNAYSQKTDTFIHQARYRYRSKAATEIQGKIYIVNKMPINLKYLKAETQNEEAATSVENGSAGQTTEAHASEVEQGPNNQAEHHTCDGSTSSTD